MRASRAVPWLGLGAVVVAWPWVANETWTTLAMLVGINILLAQSINVLTGYAGQISLGQAGFFAIGGYTSALLMIEAGCPLWLSLPAAIGFAMIVGFLLAIPAGRVQEFYLAMVTAAFGLVVQVIVKQWDLTGGFQGLSGVPAPVLGNLTLFGISLDERGYYYLVVLMVVAASWFQVNLIRSYIGRAFVAVETSEIAAASLGISPGAVKRQAYTISAGLRIGRSSLCSPHGVPGLRDLQPVAVSLHSGDGRAGRTRHLRRPLSGRYRADGAAPQTTGLPDPPAPDLRSAPAPILRRVSERPGGIPSTPELIPQGPSGAHCYRGERE